MHRHRPLPLPGGLRGKQLRAWPPNRGSDRTHGRIAVPGASTHKPPRLRMVAGPLPRPRGMRPRSGRGYWGPLGRQAQVVVCAKGRPGGSSKMMRQRGGRLGGKGAFMGMRGRSGADAWSRTKCKWFGPRLSHTATQRGVPDPPTHDPSPCTPCMSPVAMTPKHTLHNAYDPNALHPARLAQTSAATPLRHQRTWPRANHQSQRHALDLNRLHDLGTRLGRLLAHTPRRLG